MSTGSLFNERTQTFLVAGAGGNVGHEVASALVALGHRVIAPTRPMGRPAPDGADVVPALYDDPDAMASAFDGVDAMFLIAGLRTAPALLAVAKAAGVQRVVLLSSASTEAPDNQDALTRFHRRSETDVLRSGLPWTFLRPQAFASNALRWAEQIRSGAVQLPFPDLAVACVDPRDIAGVAVRALVEAGHEGCAYRLTGPESLMPVEQVGQLGRVLGRQITAVPLDDESARAHLLASTPPDIVDAFFDLYRGGGLDESVVSSAVSDVLNRRAGSFEDWAARHREAFAPT